MSRMNIAILTHNALDYTRQCLASLAAHTPADHRVYILDNGSTDGTPAWLSAQSFLQTRIILSNDNQGVARGRNVILRQINQHLAPDDLVVFLDNDVEVFRDWYVPYLELFSKQRCAGIAGATGHKVLIHSESRELLPSPNGSPSIVDVVSGFCFWIRGETVNSVGFFDENLGIFWHEDDDYCIRSISLGYEVFAVPDTKLVHHEHKSGVRMEDIASGGSAENQRYLVQKWRQLGIVDTDGCIIRWH